MKCPYCNADDNFTTMNSRPRDWGIKRVKECLSCGYHFATVEVHEFTDEAYKSLEHSQKLLDSREINKHRRNKK